MYRVFIPLVSILLFGLYSYGQSPNYSIIDHIEESGRNHIIQPQEFDQYIFNQKTEDEQIDEEADNLSKNKIGGYRVQIFSDNNPKTSKNEARSKSRNINSLFPQYRTYIFYNSPYWRVRVGDFRTYKEAEEALNEISASFPNLKKEIRIVKDRINIPEP